LKKHLTGIRNQVKGTELASMAEEIREPIWREERWAGESKERSLASLFFPRTGEKEQGPGGMDAQVKASYSNF
jgi:hypothetical protein